MGREKKRRTKKRPRRIDKMSTDKPNKKAIIKIRMRDGIITAVESDKLQKKDVDIHISDDGGLDAAFKSFGIGSKKIKKAYTRRLKYSLF